MKKVADTFVSMVLVFDEYAVDATAKVKRLSRILKARYANYEILIIDNGLPAEDVKNLKKLLPKISCIRILRLSRLHDTDTAIFAGIEASIGDTVCMLYNSDPIDVVTDFMSSMPDSDIVFGVAKNLKRKSLFERLGAKIFYWYSKRYLNIDIPYGSTYYICMNRSVANALTRSGRFMRHIRHSSKLIGFTSTNFEYELPEGSEIYSHTPRSTLFSRGIDLVSNYSSHPLRALSYFGIIAGLLNIVYAGYVVVINLSQDDIAKGWTTLSLQSSVMFFILFITLALLAEYIGKILNETQQEPPYHIMQELSSTISIADETRRNVTKG